MTAYVVRERRLTPHIRPDRPVVYDVTEAHTTRPTYYGVHTCPDRARIRRRLYRAHADPMENAA